MSGIAEALVATAVGLFVAIPAVAAFNYFQRRIQSITANTQALSNVLLAHLSAEEPLPPPTESRAEGSRLMAGQAHNDPNGMISGINMTPLVDIMLVLLIIFLVTAKLR